MSITTVILNWWNVLSGHKVGWDGIYNALLAVKVKYYFINVCVCVCLCVFDESMFFVW